MAANVLFLLNKIRKLERVIFWILRNIFWKFYFGRLVVTRYYIQRWSLWDSYEDETGSAVYRRRLAGRLHAGQRSGSGRRRCRRNRSRRALSSSRRWFSTCPSQCSASLKQKRSSCWSQVAVSFVRCTQTLQWTEWCSLHYWQLMDFSE